MENSSSDGEPEELNGPHRTGPCQCRAGDSTATVWWTAIDGDTATEFHVVRYRLDGADWSEKGQRVVIKSPITSCNVDRLTNGKTYRFAVVAVDRTGRRSRESIKSNEVTPYEPLPEPWTEHFDTNEAKLYYLNPETGQRSWNRPSVYLYQVGKQNKQRFQQKEIANMRILFQQADADSSGFLDEEEMHEVLDELNIKVSKQKFKKMVGHIDKDKSGKIEFDEFLSMMFAYQAGALDGLMGHFGKLAKNGFSLGTKMRDKMGGKEKLLELRHGQNMMAKERMGNWLSKYDEARRRTYYYNKVTQEKSWRIPDEVLWFVPEAVAAQFTQEDIEKLRTQFEQYDEDGSGEMDTDELTEAIKKYFPYNSFSHSQVLKFAKDVDLDNSGQVNFAEYIQLVQNIKTDSESSKLGKLLKSVPVLSNVHENKRMNEEIKQELTRTRRENTVLKQRILQLEGDVDYYRSQRATYVPVILLEDFLQFNNLNQYIDIMRKFGIRDTMDLYRLREVEYEVEFDFKLGHKRKLLAALRKLERHHTNDSE